MKKIVLVILAVPFLMNALNAQSLSEDINFEERVFNFGNIQEAKGKVSHRFIFQNKGKLPVTINDVSSACGCIGKVMTKGPVKPGMKGEVTITFDPAYKSGFFSKEIVVLSDNNQRYNRIWVEGVIEPAEHPVIEEYPYDFGNGLFLRLKVVTFAVKPGESQQMELHYANNTDQEMDIEFTTADNKKGLSYTNPGKVKPKAKGVIVFSYSMPTLRRRDAVFTLNAYVNKNKLNETLAVKILNTRSLMQKQTTGKN